MSEYDNTNSGALFKNKDKTPDKPNWADYQGSLNVEGGDYWISAWLKKDKSGKPYMSLSVKPKQDQPSRATRQEQAPAAAPADDHFDSDIPF